MTVKTMASTLESRRQNS